MLVEDRDRKIIIYIIDYCIELNQTVLHFGNSYEIFTSDKIYRNAAIMCILQIGELAGKLSSDFLVTHTAIPWRSVRAMRNIAAHAYGSINIEDTWETIINDIPMLKNYCQKLVEEEVINN